MKRRGVKQKVVGYWIGAWLGYVFLELACGHEKEAVQGRSCRKGDRALTVWRQRYAFCKKCKP